MAPKPIADNRQRQPLTVALKNICRDYPAGGGVLRELLQNADDAGATVVRFVLDEKFHKIEPLLDPILWKYQGPALLAYNNAEFKEEDFRNLSRLGDSLKINDGLTTGKFGRGFNSVYNWTDSPSIVSRERLLILDPHEEWSPGGPVYDFVENSADEAIQNHMQAFRTILEHPEQPLSGTIIRIPLRTEDQAKESEISNREARVPEVRKVLQKFATEFGDSGLLFMRSIEKLTIESSSGMSIEIEMVNAEKIRSHKSEVKKALQHALNNVFYEFDTSFEIQIEHRSPQESRQACFVAHHSINSGSIGDDLRVWAKDQKFVPWVAVVAQLPYVRTMQGSLFTVLPLPIRINQPVHIHGLFSVSPDRARLYQFSDSNNQDQHPAMWNRWLFQNSVPMAWTRLLSYLSCLHPDIPTFEWWPQKPDDPRDLLADNIKSIVEIIDTECLPLFPTTVGYVIADVGLLDTGKEPVRLIDALQEAKVPIVYIPQRLRDNVSHLFNGRVLSPQTLCTFLRNDGDRIKSWTDTTKQVVLEYLLSEPGFTEYGALELFPFEDGNYRSITDHAAFVHRNELESSLFALEPSRNIDLSRISAPTKRTLLKGCKASILHPSIQYRATRDFRYYFLGTIFKNTNADKDSVILDDVAVGFISKAWSWIIEQQVSILDVISDLWLIPLMNGHNRKIVPCSSLSQVIYAPEGEMGDLLRKFDAKFSHKASSLLDIGRRGISSKSLYLLMEVSRRTPKMLIKDSNNILDLTQWLSQIHASVKSASDEEKHIVLKVIASNLPQSLSNQERKAISDSLLPLEIFRRVCWKAEGDKSLPGLEWTHLSASGVSVGLLDGLFPIPAIDDVQFLDARWSSLSYKLLTELQSASCYEMVDIIVRYIIPAWQRGQTSSWGYSCKEQIAKLLLGQYSRLPQICREALRTLPIVPVVRINGEPTSKFAVANELIDPSMPDLKILFFDDEEALPTEDFFAQFGVALKGCGLKTIVDEALINNRTQCYARVDREVSEIQRCAYELLKSPLYWTEPTINSQLRQLEWLPIVDLEGNLRLEAPNKCRSSRDRLLVSFQLPIFELPISAEWEKRLGWRNRLPNRIILAQLAQALERSDRAVVNEVLFYIYRKGQTEQLASDLQKLPCVLTSSGMFVTPSKAFHLKTGILECELLHPYIGSVDNTFWGDHTKLLTRLNIERRPSLENLLSIQRTLELKQSLDDADVIVAIEILKLARHLPKPSLADLKVLSNEGTFCSIHDINYHDLGILSTTEKVNLTHPDIPHRIIRNLGIESLSERLKKGLLEIADIDDEDEFDQREQVATRIIDTLDRYPVNTTFREYLANADDTRKASRISWLLDERIHPSNSVLTPELKSCQGPALLVYNNGVFSEDDFKGFKNVGEGSKRDDQGTIGQFGRGSQTMYHWTDVPMILSGGYLLILDPQQEVLPKNQIKGKRKPGVKLELSKLKRVCPDQLAPFEGLWDYQQDLDYFPGTIFRFPLRAKESESKLKVNKMDLDKDKAHSLIDEYFQEARISLIYLRHILSIDFKIFGKPDSGWSISKQAPTDKDLLSFSNWVVCSFAKDMDSHIPVTGTDKWWVAIEDLRPETNNLPFSPRRAMKNVESGIAALVASKSNNSNPLPQAVKPRMFNILPLPISLDLPVYVHATFSLSGDRQSLVVDEHGHDSNGSMWNIYLLGTALPNLYLSFLEDLGSEIEQDELLKFWPQEYPPKRSCSEIIYYAFWENLRQSSARLFPKAQIGPVFGRSRRKLFDIHQAIFDFLPYHQSNVLAPLLLSFRMNLVWNIPLGISKHLIQFAEVNCVTGSMLRKLFKSELAKLRLKENISKNPRIMEILLDLVIPAGDDLEELDDCFLPLANGNLGTLKLINSSTAGVTYYAASVSEMKLFEFSSELLLSREAHKPFKKVLKSKNFNIEMLQLPHIKELLKKRNAPTTVNLQETEWLTKFWDFWNKSAKVWALGKESADISVESLESDLKEFVLFQASCHGSESYFKPSQFQELPGVIEPLVKEHKVLAGKIPGLYLFNWTFMPTVLRDNERSFNDRRSFCRLIKGIREVAAKDGVETGTFVRTHLTSIDLKVLQEVTVAHVSWAVGSTSTESQELIRLNADLKLIPLWPSCDAASPELMAANGALEAPSNGFLVPWMKHYSQFIESRFVDDTHNQNCLRTLGMKQVVIKPLLLEYILPLPSMTSDLNWKYYQPLIASISHIGASQGYSSIEAILRRGKITSDENRNLHKASELFDHNDPVFVAAFRDHSADKFVHDDVKIFRQLWLKAGICHRKNGSFDPEDYIKCIQAMNRRIITRDLAVLDDQLMRDIKTVLSPLVTPNSSIHKLGYMDWLTISSEKVFPSRERFSAEPAYRYSQMCDVSAKQKFLALTEIVSYNHVAVCWSQTPFALEPPTSEVLSKFGSYGKPPTTMVWKHLNHLRQMTQNLQLEQVQNFLSDLHSTYAYLQDHIEESRASGSLPPFSTSAIWLNINSSPGEYAALNSIQTSWYEAKDLVLSSSCDAGPIKAVRPSLMRYEKLLRALGCNSITYPTITRPTLHHGRSVSASLQKLRHEGKLLDITYSTEGRLIKAHRVVLAAISDMCARQFNGRWKVENLIKYDKDEDPDSFLSYHALSTMIDYAYEDEVHWSVMEVSDVDDAETRETKLHMLLDLHKGASFWLIPTLASQVEDKILVAGKLFINIENVEEIRQRAEEVGAKEVEKMCIKFIDQNRATVQRANSATSP